MVKIMATVKPELREARYAVWLRKKLLTEDEIRAMQKVYPIVKVEKIATPEVEKPKGIGLGDAIKAVTDFMGVKQCGGCKRRQEKLNKIRI